MPIAERTLREYTVSDFPNQDAAHTEVSDSRHDIFVM
jgi:hypothetical protein